MTETVVFPPDVSLPDLKALIGAGPAPLFATLGGAHLYGYPSADTAPEVRGVVVLPLRDVLRLRTPQETIAVRRLEGARSTEWMAHDVSKFARLLMRRNGSTLEQLHSPMVVCGGPWLEELRTIAGGFVVRHLFHHYRGSFWSQWKQLQKPQATLRQMLDTMRIGLTGVHLLRSGAVECALPRLLDGGGPEEIHELLARKREGEEGTRLYPDDLERYRAVLESLETSLGQAYERSTLPDVPSTLSDLDDFVVRARLQLGA